MALRNIPMSGALRDAVRLLRALGFDKSRAAVKMSRRRAAYVNNCLVRFHDKADAAQFIDAVSRNRFLRESPLVISATDKQDLRHYVRNCPKQSSKQKTLMYVPGVDVIFTKESL